MDLLNRLQKPIVWLLGTTTAMIALHLTLLSRSGDAELSQGVFATYALVWCAVASLLWERRQTLMPQTGSLSTAIGGCLLLGLLWLSAALPTYGFFLRGFPLVMVLGLGLLASGLRRLHQYWKELFIFGLLMLNPLLKLGLDLINLPRFTAQAAAFMLWYTGFDVRLDGLSLLLPTGRVDVYGACSGVGSMLQMLNLSVLFVLIIALPSVVQQLLSVLLAVFIGFMVNAARVALMAVLVAFSQKSAFDYWHTGDGSLIFAAIAVGLFGLFSWFAFLRMPQSVAEAGTLPNDD
ncbi:MAG: cyanoexosortase A [Stenomitos rutilans HA7619-LM2]|jgi:cyanoexosortase A|nr:cyanoexosortase A [Stenomitos rutilans HA7619-LM2]